MAKVQVIEGFSDSASGDDAEIDTDEATEQSVATVSKIESGKSIKKQKRKTVSQLSTKPSNVIDDDSVEEVEKMTRHSGLATAMAKILGSQGKGNAILSRAKKDADIEEQVQPIKEQVEFEVDGVIVPAELPNKKPKMKDESLKDIKMRKKTWDEMWRSKPDFVADREKERKLRTIATHGVVQLFSAIEKHSRSVQQKLSEAHGEIQREKVLHSMGKDAFLSLLTEEGKKSRYSQNLDELKDEVKDEIEDAAQVKKPRWNVLADDFYKEPTLQGWDQMDDEG